MNTVPTRSYSLTLPYHSSTGVPRAHQREYERVRNELQDVDITARQALERAERWQPNWSEDLDPSPKRVFRTSEAHGEKQSLAVETQDAPGKYQRPSKLVQEKEGHHKSTALFNNKGEVTRIEQTLRGHDGGVEEMTIVVNRKTNTITYSIHETGQFALEPLGYPSASSRSGAGSGAGECPEGARDRDRGGSGPDDVYDEFDNSRRGGGPDEVWNEWDNGRGSYFDGPDGRTSYDPYH
jgi:hypothetical protein